MKSVFDPKDYQDIVTRLDTLTPGTVRQWGKMTAPQMLEHVSRVIEMATGSKPTKQILLGKLISWTVWPTFIGPKQFGRNAPTGPAFVVRDEPEFTAAKQRLRSQVEALHALGEQGCDGQVHAFFGPMRGKEWGITQYKHIDHHFRQFGV